MILVDTSIWIDHLHAREPRLVELLHNDDVGCHDKVIEEIALGSIARRNEVLELLTNLYRFPLLAHHEILALVNAHRLWGRGLSAVDVHLLGAVALVPGARLWSRDKRMMAAADDAGIGTGTNAD